MEQMSKNRDFLLPGSIIIAAVLIASSVFYSAGKKTGGETKNLAAGLEAAAASLDNVRPVESDDHILGNLKAPVVVIEYSDLECPFCKVFHETMHTAVQEYKGKVAWVYRQLPLSSLHPKAAKEAEASECAAELGGNEVFWKYIDKIFEVTPSNNGLNFDLLPAIAKEIGIHEGKFNECLSSGRHAGRVAASVQDAGKVGARGTPYSIVIAKNGKKFVIPGALPFKGNDPDRPDVKTILDEALKN